jgi:hypothetical protein
MLVGFTRRVFDLPGVSFEAGRMGSRGLSEFSRGFRVLEFEFLLDA